ncbi:hypothetical protein BH11PSE5_BH11PSE5_03420 [soil metagenome]
MKTYPNLNFESNEEIEELLNIAVEQEAMLLNISAADAQAHRQSWVGQAVPARALMKRWRLVSAINVPTYCRLTGKREGAVKKAMQPDGLRSVIEPFTGKAFISIWQPLAEGFSLSEIRRAQNGEDVYRSRQTSDFLRTPK